MTLLRCVVGSFFLMGCIEPFDTDRHHLKNFRILHAHVHNGIADAVVWSGYGVYHQKSPQLRWFVEGELVAQGFSVEVPISDEYELEVESHDGEIRRALVPYGQKNQLLPILILSQ